MEPSQSAPKAGPVESVSTGVSFLPTLRSLAWLFLAYLAAIALNRHTVMPRSTTRQAIQFTGLIQGSDDHQWLVADAIRDVDTGGRGGPPLHRWTITTEVEEPEAQEAAQGVPYYVARAHGTEWHAFAPSPHLLAQAIRVGFPRAMRRKMRKDAANEVNTVPGDGGVTIRGPDLEIT